MAPIRPASSWTRGIDLPSTLLETGSDDYELYEEEDEFVLTVEMPGFDLEDVEVSWDDGVRASRRLRTERARARQSSERSERV